MFSVRVQGVRVGLYQRISLGISTPPLLASKSPNVYFNLERILEVVVVYFGQNVIVQSVLRQVMELNI